MLGCILSHLDCWSLDSLRGGEIVPSGMDSSPFEIG